MKLRLVTGLIIGAIALFLIFWAPAMVTTVAFVLIGMGAVFEFVSIVGKLLPSAPLRSLLLYIPVYTILGLVWLHQNPLPAASPFLTLAVLTSIVLVAGTTTLLGRTAIPEALYSMGTLAFAIPYFSLPLLALCWLVAVDRSLLFLLVAVVAFGDSFAYFVGRKIGRHKLAPVVSPKKSWEGAVAGTFASFLTAALYCHFHLGHYDVALIVVAMGTALFAQLGDLVQSLVKRAADIKDSSQILPGHGGIYDRLDALIFAAPFFVSGLWACGLQFPMPP